MAQADGHALLACDAIARDPNGKITLYGIFDRIWATKFPAVHSLFSIYWRCLVPGPGRAGVSIHRPDGSVLVELEPIETSKETPHTIQGTYTLAAFEFPGAGEYTLVLTYNGTEILRSPIHLQTRS
ncbi:MAG: hypothetical protein HY726_07525 [Candidatus Rokubacteria bacterium]|nr:hypothetical protein [Candidatus Rokubacteria bacterium]